jgi:hypothetical protein
MPSSEDSEGGMAVVLRSHEEHIGVLILRRDPPRGPGFVLKAEMLELPTEKLGPFHIDLDALRWISPE